MINEQHNKSMEKQTISLKEHLMQSWKIKAVISKVAYPKMTTIVYELNYTHAPIITDEYVLLGVVVTVLQ